MLCICYVDLNVLMIRYDKLMIVKHGNHDFGLSEVIVIK